MGKQAILVFWLAGLVSTVADAILVLQFPLQQPQAPVSLPAPLTISAALLIVASVANLVTWIGALALSGRIGAWGWLVAALLEGK